MSNSDSDHRAQSSKLSMSDDESGTVAWFDQKKQFGFVALSNGSGDAFLHMSVLKAAGYVWLPRGTTVRVRTEDDRGRRRVTEVIAVDTSTARGEAEAIVRKPKT